MRLRLTVFISGTTALVAALVVQGQVAPAALSDQAVRAQRVQAMSDRAHAEKAAARAWAEQHGWQVRRVENGAVYELVAIRDDRPRVYVTTNVNAAISANVTPIRNVSPYDLNGLWWTVGIWDGGSVRATHQEFGGRINVMDGGSPIHHATHVGGTIGAAGVVASALGMAPSVTIDSYEWNNDLGEMTSRAMSFGGEAGTLQISNHSYGYAAGWDFQRSPIFWWGNWGSQESSDFGYYSSESAAWDDLCYGAPYYLPFKSAGNDRGDGAPSAGTTFQYRSGVFIYTTTYDPAIHPYADNYDSGGFDTLTTVAVAKNLMVVGAMTDAVSGGLRSVPAAAMTYFSAWGPADDGRVKPDVVANGDGLYSSFGGSDTQYGTYSGTSMSTPNACGAAALLLDQYGRLFPGQYMRSSTLKGLVIHTADDVDLPGPDYRTGWGLVNAQAAADHIRLHAERPGANLIAEGLLTKTSNPSDSFEFFWDGTGPIRATLCWTDPAGSAVSGLDNPTPVLVNDLDLRITDPDGVTVHMPFVLDRLNPAQAATTGDNTVDNVEQVLISSPVAGLYTAEITYKGRLTQQQQYYSVLISAAISELPADFDNDGDSDDDDVAHLLGCMSGSNVTQSDPLCADTLIDDDDDVDSTDFGWVQRCLNGTLEPPPLDCLDGTP